VEQSLSDNSILNKIVTNLVVQFQLLPLATLYSTNGGYKLRPYCDCAAMLPHYQKGNKTF